MARVRAFKEPAPAALVPLGASCTVPPLMTRDTPVILAAVTWPALILVSVPLAVEVMRADGDSAAAGDNAPVPPAGPSVSMVPPLAVMMMCCEAVKEPMACKVPLSSVTVLVAEPLPRALFV